MLQPRRVLLADDDLNVRSGVEELLSPLGLEIVHADSGSQAFEIARERLHDLHLLLLDLHMPGMTGLDVLTSLRGELDGLTPLRGELDGLTPLRGEIGGRRPRPSRIPPCILYSAEASEELRSRALALGAWAFLRKPVAPHALRGEVLRALESAG
ncbi:MAG: response regulator [Planctomycetes bacterium]|nr:response regulator [Planctomycetota bacterium]